MMAWIEAHQELKRHPKLIALATVLEIPKVVAMGHLFSMWFEVLDFAPDGVVTKCAPQLLATWAEWEGDANEFYAALVSCGWLDKRGRGVTVHDWWDYAGKLVQKRIANRSRMREARAAHVHRTKRTRAGATVPTVPTVPTNQPSTAGNSRTGKNGKRLTVKTVAKALNEYEQFIHQDTNILVDHLLMRFPQLEYAKTWATIIDSRDKNNPAGHLSKCVGDPTWSPTDKAFRMASREIEEYQKPL